jgi:GH25 family lysozyme M1 (1,4-beta-N-acetylmuramidase)
VNVLLANGWTKNDLAILDLEWTPPKNTNLPIGAALAYNVKVWLDLVEKALGVKPIIYTSRNFWGYLLDRQGNPPAWTKDYLFWVAWYPEGAYIDLNTSLPASALPTGVTLDQVVGWQYAANWILPGIPYDGVDVSVFYVDKLGIAPAPVPTPAPAPITVTKTITINITTNDPNTQITVNNGSIK